REGRGDDRQGPAAVRGAAAGDVGRGRRLRLDREALPPPGRDRDAMGAHDRLRDARGRHDHDPRPRLARAGTHSDRGRAGPTPGAPARALDTARPGMTLGWHELEIQSRALEGNPLGDSPTRPLFVWTPPAYDAGSDRRFPSVYLLQGLTGEVRAWFNVAPFVKSWPAMVEEAGVAAFLVFVDAFTALGGSQFLDSPAIGRYGTYLTEEVVPFVDERFRTLPDAAHRGIQGKSSGGFGAMVWGMLRTDLFGAFATHAGDSLWEVSALPAFPAAAQALRNEYGGSYAAFWADFRSRPPFAKKSDALLLEIYTSAAAYSSTPEGGVE